MSPLSVGVRNSILDAIARNTALQIAALHVQLHIGDPGAAGTSNPAAETDRIQLTFGAAAASGSISTTADAEWTNVAATETYSHVSLWSASTGGTFVGAAALAAPKDVNLGDTFRIPSGSGTLTAT